MAKEYLYGLMGKDTKEPMFKIKNVGMESSIVILKYIKVTGKKESLMVKEKY